MSVVEEEGDTKVDSKGGKVSGFFTGGFLTLATLIGLEHMTTSCP